jgi:hypothetical protein
MADSRNGSAEPLLIGLPSGPSLMPAAFIHGFDNVM